MWIRHGGWLRAAVVILLSFLTDGAPKNSQDRRNGTAMDEVVEANTKQDSMTGRSQAPMGDMIFPKITTSAGSQDYSAASDARHKLWPNGKIFYKMSENITQRPNHLRLIKAAMAEWERDTCIRFINKTDADDVKEYVYIYYGTGCRGSVGRWDGKKSLLSLGKFCDKFRIVLHELGHTIGFFHEQNRRDRDYYVEILWRNINPRWTRAFYLRVTSIKKPSTPYDYYSIMHYGTHTYSINGEPTLKSRDPSIKYLGNTGLSLMDIKQTNILYNCIDFPNFPEDFFFTKGQKDKTPNCVAMDEPGDPLWNTTSICYNENKKNINLQWSNSGPIPYMSCTNMAMPNRRNYARFWQDNYICVPSDSVLRFGWSVSGPIRGMKCKGIRVHSGSSYLYHLCAVRTHKTTTKRVLEDSNYTSWSPWQPCSKECGGGNQSRFRRCKNQRICKESLVETRVCNKNKCSSWPHWPRDFQFYIGHSKVGSITTCINIYERNQYIQWLNHKFCWTIMRRRRLKILWSDMNKVPGMRCTQITEPRERRGSGWDNNFLCVQQDAPYRFQWSANGTIEGLYCQKWMGKEGMDGWDNNYLCAHKYPENAYTSWSTWQACDRICGGGMQKRVRQCKTQINCTKSLVQTKACNSHRCIEPSVYSLWSAWQPCSKTCGNGTQRRIRHCQEGGTCLERLGETRPCNVRPCFEWPHWPYEFHFHVGSKPRSSACIRIFEREQYNKWKNTWFCWDGIRKGQLELDWIEKEYSPKGRIDELTGMRCTKITEPQQKKDRGWNDNYLCVQRDAPYRFRWSSSGKMEGLHCIKWMVKNGKDGWDNNYLCANKSTNGSDYTQWLSWQSCSKTCGGGRQRRSRECYTRVCNERLEETRNCNIRSCPKCPKDWVTWKTESSHFCYRLEQTRLTWRQAREQCKHLKANLLSLGSQEEFEYIKNNVQKGGRVWIGANDRGTEEVWRWTDGTNFTFSNWSKNEPNNGGGSKNEDCAMMTRDGQWNDYPCTARHRFYYICKTVPNKLLP